MKTARQALERLEEIVEKVEYDLMQYGRVHPDIARDHNGRYILVDAYASLVLARAAVEALPQEPDPCFCKDCLG